MPPTPVTHISDAGKETLVFVQLSVAPRSPDAATNVQPSPAISLKMASCALITSPQTASVQLKLVLIILALPSVIICINRVVKDPLVSVAVSYT